MKVDNTWLDPQDKNFLTTARSDWVVACFQTRNDRKDGTGKWGGAARLNGRSIEWHGDETRIPGSTRETGSLHVNSIKEHYTGAFSIGEIAAWDWEIPTDQLLAFEYHMLERWGIERLPKFDNW